MVPQRLSLVTLGARNLPELRRFYKDLGWAERAQSSDEFAVFQTAGVLLALFPFAELAKDAGVPLREATDAISPIALAINVDKAADVDAVISSVEAAGARVLRQPSDAFWGGRTAYFVDPENNLWEVAWNPTAVFDERGGMVSF